MVLVGLQLPVVAELHVDCPAAYDWGRGGEHGDHTSGGSFVGHLQEGLVLALEDQDVGNASEWDSQVHDVHLARFVRDVPDVDHPRWFGCTEEKTHTNNGQ